LQAAEIPGYAFGECLGDERFADSRHIFQKDVFAGQQRYQAPADDIGFAQDDSADVAFQLGNQLVELLAG
jgi:hypothetical protein